MTLPFKILDGERLRYCTYDDLFIMCFFGLHFDTYVKGAVLDTLGTRDTIELLYGAIKALKEANRIGFPMSYMDVLIVVDYHQISMVECKELYLWHRKPFIKMALRKKWI